MTVNRRDIPPHITEGRLRELVRRILQQDGRTINNVTNIIEADVTDLEARILALESAPVPAGVPVGTVISYAGASIPTDWLLCNGSNVSRATYSDLFTAIGTTWGVGDGSTTFGLPPANIFAYNVGGTHSLGNTGGAEEHFLTHDEMPVHSHFMQLRNGSAGAFPVRAQFANGAGAGNTATGNAGANEPHNNMPPYGVFNFIIRHAP